MKKNIINFKKFVFFYVFLSKWVDDEKNNSISIFANIILYPQPKQHDDLKSLRSALKPLGIH